MLAWLSCTLLGTTCFNKKPVASGGWIEEPLAAEEWACPLSAGGIEIQ